MEPGGTWKRLLQAPTTWIVLAAVLFVLAVVLLVAGALAGRRARREQRAQAADEQAADEQAVAPATRRLLGALVGDPEGALAGVGALERGGEPGRAAVTLLRSGVPAPAVARLCGVAAEDLGDLVATTLGILATQAPSVPGRAGSRGEAQVGEIVASAPVPTG